MSSERRGRGRGRGSGSKHDSQPRSVLVSKALSRLLRHAAVEERIPIDNHGYVRMDHLLGWQRLRSLQPPVTFDEVIEVVQENEKKRFALKYVGGRESETEGENEAMPAPAPAPTQTLQVEAAGLAPALTEPATESQAETETQRAISIFQATHGTGDVRRFFIRAAQGHSMKTVEAESLLTPISLNDSANVLDTVVHGTFYGSWERILQSGGLKRMARNHVHFATGPALDEVLPSATGDEDRANVGSILGKNKVISGMRSDAQILIYIDIRKALADRPDMKWWRSENGVILTEGVSPSSSSTSASTSTLLGSGDGDGPKEEEARQPGKGTEAIETRKASEEEKLVPMEYWLAAVEVKEGLGLLWKQGEGTMRELPEHLRNKAPPFGKGGRNRGRGRGRGQGRGRG
ncbi:hypothetical protein A1O3_09619 [Capronia epimyces CBS 606.96]|uniref:2'-phosphotransferase n=1 Tax=Capronia epimyces CBS 606.96 TaxID=1182542 RepID=W9XB09_9EURO|nr:uncharacterized protein A1O3_09619 [Capronia epimyces CBS 606.96]EXJ77393.1 hypothetical protein A1O3_09619 [Capronia epimyces CBS 606.96]